MLILLFLNQNAQIWEIGPRPQILGNFEFVSFHLKVPHQYDSNELSTTIHHFLNWRYANFTVFDPKCPNMENWAQTPNFGKFRICFISFKSAPPLPFQRPLNNYSSFYKTQVMPILLFLAQNTQIWKIGPRPPNLGKFRFFLTLVEIATPLRFQRALNDCSSLANFTVLTQKVWIPGVMVFFHILHY